MESELSEQSALSFSFLTLLSGLTAMGQFATSVYLPSLPSIGREFSAPVPMVQLTLLVYLLCFAVFQIIFGPLTDRFGRKPILYVGIITFLAGSILSYASPTLALLILGRAVQGIGGSATIVVGRAVTRDTHSGMALAQALLIITIVFSAAPGLAPLLGGFLEVSFGWRSTFLASSILAILLLCCVIIFLRETHLQRPSNLTLKSIWELYKPLWQSWRFMVYIGASSFAMGGLYVFFSGGPQLFIHDLHVSPAEYGLYPSFTVLGFVAGGIAARKLIMDYGAERLSFIGLVMMLVGASLMLAFPLSGIVNPFAYNGCMFVFVAGLGITLSLSIAEALRDFPERAGAASALAGFLQMLGASLGTALFGRLAHIPIFAVPIAMLTMSLCGLLFFVTLSRKI
ncbi:MAG: multidrug effflux MFS transporter [Candidatus Kapabacteria bacterium]|jgi:DHA1 family bicyclomycin/chloramphenicol resistance-like MFS transporter|nr:multidrug effflux MFS transporter [Candidatus Kapabacteria bacterium]